MSRRHHHHVQPYDYDRFHDHPREREREREREHQTRGIEYQDDSLSSINSDDESYLHHQHSAKDKKQNFYQKNESNNKQNKAEKTPNDIQTSAPADTSQRLERLESMLELLIKKNSPPVEPVISNQSIPEKSSERRSQYRLEPRKHNFTTSMWINKIQEVSIQNNWDEKTTIAYMESQMSGLIKAWYNSLENYDYTWPELKILITKVFPDNIDFVTTLKRLVTRLKQANETMNNYYFSKMYLIEACKITGEDAVSCLIDGLNNQSIQEQAKSQNYLTPETLYSQFLTILPEYTVDYSPAAASNSDSALNNWHYEEQTTADEENLEIVESEEQIVYEKDARNEQFDYRNHEVEQRSVKTPPKRSVPVHSRLDKRFIRSNNFKHQNKIPMAAKLCSICGLRGHLTRNCRKARKALISKCSHCESRNHFYKKCSLNGHRFDAFIDTGCTTTTLRENEAKDMNLQIRSSSKYIEVFGGGRVPILGETEALLKIDSVEVRVEVVVVANHVQHVPVIVGQEFLNKKNVCIFLQNETLQIFEAPSILTE